MQSIYEFFPVEILMQFIDNLDSCTDIFNMLSTCKYAYSLHDYAFVSKRILVCLSKRIGKCDLYEYHTKIKSDIHFTDIVRGFTKFVVKSILQRFCGDIDYIKHTKLNAYRTLIMRAASSIIESYVSANEDGHKLKWFHTYDDCRTITTCHPNLDYNIFCDMFGYCGDYDKDAYLQAVESEDDTFWDDFPSDSYHHFPSDHASDYNLYDHASYHDDQNHDDYDYDHTSYHDDFDHDDLQWWDDDDDYRPTESDIFEISEEVGIVANLFGELDVGIDAVDSDVDDAVDSDVDDAVDSDVDDAVDSDVDDAVMESFYDHPVIDEELFEDQPILKGYISRDVPLRNFREFVARNKYDNLTKYAYYFMCSPDIGRLLSDFHSDILNILSLIVAYNDILLHKKKHLFSE
jgi:hypothetical protein